MAGATASRAQGLWSRVQTAVGHGDLLLAAGVVGILTVLILPLPSLVLDALLAISVTFSILILLTALFIEKPLDFNAFPTVLLITTMLRLALNIASTRLILSNGHEGTDAAGHVIQAFGQFVMRGDLLIGLIVFAILVIVNFVVITKGSGRIAEVAARFSLDAMPGKQMAIDADLSAGLIDEATARGRRRELEEESAFFGAMDGAAKFVRGDAIAGLLITAINLVAGLIIGTVQMDMALGDAARTYSVLTVGDGLVSQVPALIVSTAAGLLVSKAGVTGRADRALFGQLGAYPRALGATAALAFVVALLPGMPLVPFLLLAGGSGWLAWQGGFRPAVPAAPAAPEPTAVEAAEPLAPPVDALRIELGYGLLGLIGESGDARLTEQIKALRRQLAGELGFILPSVRIQDNIQLPSATYVIRVKEMEAARGEVRPGMLLVMDPQGQPIDLPGEATVEPTFGLPAMWISPGLREEATLRGLTVVDATTVLTTHLTEVVRDNITELLTLADTQKLLAELPAEYQKLLSEIVPARISAGGIQRVLLALLGERVSIRDLAAIVEAIGEAAAMTSNLTTIVEHVRARLARQISHAATGIGGYIPVIGLSPAWEQRLHEALAGDGAERHLALPPSDLQELVRAIGDAVEAQAARGELAVILTSPALRPHLRAVIERFRPAQTVLSHAEIHPRARLRTLAQI